MSGENRIRAILTGLAAVAARPGEAAERLKREKGKPLVGVLPYYAPEEIVHAAGMLPVGVWGGTADASMAGHYFPPFACPLVKSTLDLALRGVYDGLAAMIVPALCESLTFFGQNFRAARPGIPFVPVVHPQNRRTPEGVAYLRAEYERVRDRLAEIAGREVTAADLDRAIGVFNDHRRAMRAFLEEAPRHPSLVSPRVRHAVAKSAYYMDKADHGALVGELTGLLKSLPEESGAGKRVVVTGIMAEPEGLLDLFEEVGLEISADDLAQESRAFRTDVPDGGDPLERLARRWSLVEGCSLAFDPGKERNRILLDLVRNSGARGLVVLMIQFCDPEEMDYPLYRKELDAAGVPVLHLEVEPRMSLEQARTRLQSFAEMI
ncbi:MAG TPA: 2-hydroxyacyl-CoA dehydratase family protein [Syntrophales bacterium]|nr:2-hydroxyacyl-CoA dehydratase family protein [Syntrophales bacterium]